MSETKATVRAVAAAAGVAPSTASLILRGEGRFSRQTIDRVLKAAATLNFEADGRPVRPLTPGSTNVAGVITFGSMALTLRDPHTQELLRGLHNAFAEAGVSLMLLPPIGGPALQPALESMPLDIVCAPAVFADLAPALAVARRRGIAFAHLESGGMHPLPTMVPVDDAAVMTELGELLIANGHRRIAVVALGFSDVVRTGLVALPPLGTISNAVVRSRLEGLARAGIEPAYVYETAAASAQECDAAVRTFLRLAEPPTAIVCQTDDLAEAVVAALRSRGVGVPQEVSVTGYDGVDTPSLAPGFLTTVRQDGVLKGRMLAAAALALRAGERPTYEPLKQNLVRGASLGPAAS